MNSDRELCCLVSPVNHLFSALWDKFRNMTRKIKNIQDIICITDPQRKDPEYLNDTNDAGYKHPIKTLDS